MVLSLERYDRYVLKNRLRRGVQAQLEVASSELRAVMVGAVLIMAGFGLIIPTLQLYAKKFGVGDAGVSLLITSFAAMRLVGNLFVGKVLVRYGERTITVAGAIIVGISSLAAAAAVNYPMLLIMRTIGGIGSAFYFGGLLSFLLARVPPHQRGRATGLFQGAVTAGIFVGPVIGGLLVGWTSENVPFAVYGVTCLVGAGWSFKTMIAPITEHAVAVKPQNWKVLKELMSDGAYRIALSAAMMGFIVMLAPQAILASLWIEDLSLSKATLGIPYTVITGASLAVVFHAGHIVDRVGRRGVLILGSFGLALSLAAVAFSSSMLTILLAFGLMGISTGYSRPAVTSVLADVATEERRQVAIGGFRVAQDLGGLIGPGIAGVLSQVFGPRTAFTAIAVVGFCVAAYTLRLRETAPHLVSESAN